MRAAVTRGESSAGTSPSRFTTPTTAWFLRLGPPGRFPRRDLPGTMRLGDIGLVGLDDAIKEAGVALHSAANPGSQEPSGLLVQVEVTRQLMA